MFIGEYSHNIDAKGRMAVPAKFRSKLKNGAIVTPGIDNCLSLYSKEEWEKRASQVAVNSIYKKNSRAFSRFMFTKAMEVEFDKQGRILLPDYLRRYAGLGKKAIVAGVYNVIEIWDEKAWIKYSKANEKNSVKIAEELGEIA